MTSIEFRELSWRWLMPGPAVKFAILCVWLFALLLFACNNKSSKQQPVFYCQREATNRGVPIPSGTRTCEKQPLEEGIYGPSFTTPIAYCFTRSMMGIPPAPWGSQTVDSCSPTPSECEEDHDSTGTGIVGQPPVKTKCHREEL